MGELLLKKGNEYSNSSKEDLNLELNSELGKLSNEDFIVELIYIVKYC